MAHGFVIMQIGNAQLDEAYEQAIAPGIRDAGLEPKRIDIDTGGGLLKSEIVDFLAHSDILVADLTNERPNCYLEVGYAMGLGRNRYLILTARCDHFPDDPGYVAGGPKLHFDLAGYEVVAWSPDDLEKFRKDLTTRIGRRLAITQATEGGTPTAAPSPDAEWIVALRDRAIARIHSIVGPGHMELAFGLAPPKIQVPAAQLLEASRTATIDTFGWPIGVSIETEEGRTKPTGEGIRAEVSGDRWNEDRSYDVWELRTDGDFAMFQSLYEDQGGRPDAIFFNTRIIRVTEAVLYCARLYETLGVQADASVELRVAHGGLTARTLSSSSARRLSVQSTSAADRAGATVSFALGSVSRELPRLVQELLDPMFELFDFFSPGVELYTDIITAFVAGKNT